MNNKGFTLVELLATIAILGLVLGIGSVSVIHTINNSKTKSEKIFVEKVAKSIDDYLDLNGGDLRLISGVSYTFEKCVDTICKSTYSVTAGLYNKGDAGAVTLRDLIRAKLIDEATFVNPRNKKKCLGSEEEGPEILIFKDSEYVYYYYVDLSLANTACEIEENGVIDTLPDALVKKLSCDSIPDGLKSRKNDLVETEGAKCTIES